MKREEHEQISKEMFGEEYQYPEIHKYIDRFFKIFGQRHRIIFHHRLGINFLRQKFKGTLVREVIEQHIIDDLGEIPNDPNWIYYDLDLQYADRFRIKNGFEDHDDLRTVLKKLYPNFELKG